MVPAIHELGATLVAICPQRPEFLKKMKEKHGLTFPILRDEGNQVAEQFGLRHVLPEYLREIYLSFSLDLPRFNNDDSWSLAMPARYVVNPQGKVVAADFDPDYTNRPEPGKIVQDLQAL